MSTTYEYNLAKQSNPNLTLGEFVKSRPKATTTVDTNVSTTTPTDNPTTVNTDTVNTSPVAFQRDFDREKASMDKIGANSGQLNMLDPRKLYEMTYNQDELNGLTEYQQINQRNQAKANLLETPKPTNSMMRVLEDALRAKTSVGNQALGGSELFAKAGLPTQGVSGYATLMQSMNQRGSEMQDKYKSFSNSLARTGEAMSDTWNTALGQYEVLNEDYQNEKTRLQGITDNLVKHEQAMEIMQEQYDLQEKAKQWGLDQEPTADEKATWKEKGYTYVDGEYINSNTLDAKFSGIGNKNDDSYAECGYMSNRLTTGQPGDKQWVGDTWESKISKVTHYDSPTPGDKLVTPLGGRDNKGKLINGHVSTVLGFDPNARTVDVVEWNAKGDHQKEFNTYSLDEMSTNYTDSQKGGKADWGFVEADLKPEFSNLKENTDMSNPIDSQFESNIIDWANDIDDGEVKITAVPKEDRETVNRLRSLRDKELKRKIDSGEIEKGGITYNTLTADKQLIAEEVANYKADPAKIESIRSGARTKLYAAAKELNPNFDAIKLPGKFAYYKNYQSGDISNQIKTANEVAGQLEVLNEKAKALGTTWLPKWNAAKQVFDAETGKPEIKAFRITAMAMAQKLGRLFKGSKGVVSEAESERWLKELVESESPEQMEASYIGAMEMVGETVSSLRGEYERTMEEDFPEPVWTEESRESMLNNGIDANEWDPVEDEKPVQVKLTEQVTNLGIQDTNAQLVLQALIDKQGFRVEDALAGGATPQELEQWLLTLIQ